MLASTDNYLHVSSSAHARAFRPYGSTTWLTLFVSKKPPLDLSRKRNSGATSCLHSVLPLDMKIL